MRIGYPGKPAAADLQLGLATAPVLFATAKFPQLNAMIERRFRCTEKENLNFPQI
jgi:hypothetical protein